MKNILVISYIPVVRNYDNKLFHSESNAVVCINPFGKSKLTRWFSILLMLINFSSILFHFIFKDIDFSQYDLIIINEMKYPHLLVRWIRKRSSVTIVYQLWNTIDKIPKRKVVFFELHKIVKDYNVIICSFDKCDCDRYGLLKNKQFIPVFSTKNEKILYDVVFIGRDKGRSKYLKIVKQYINKAGFKCLFLLLDDKCHWMSYSDYKVDFLVNQNYLDYIQVVKILKQSRVILDIVQDGQNGLTWRPIEAAMYKKKLITNYVDIVDEEIYESSNVYILEQFNVDEIKEFLEYNDDYSYKNIRSYTFDGWLDNLSSNT